jgi:kinesin family protein C1
MSRRMSLGIGRSTPLSDASSVQNRRSSLYRSDTPTKRVASSSRPTHPRATDNADTSYSKRQRHNHEPLLPRAASTVLPTGPNPSPMDGLTAVERIRMRRMMQQQNILAATQQLQDDSFLQSSMNNNINSSFEHQDYFDHDATTTMSFRMPSSTPGSRRQSISVLQNRNPILRSQESDHGIMNSSSSYLLPPSNSQNSYSMMNHSNSLSQQTVDSATNEAAVNDSSSLMMDTVEGAGLRSSNRQLQLRVEQLEREKMALCMSKAPLEARFRQQQDTWEREAARMRQEIQELTVARSCAENANRDLTLKHDAVETEVRQLRLELRKASSSFTSMASSNGASDHMSMNNGSGMMMMGGNLWKQKQLQYDKELAELKEEVQALELDKVSIEKELHANKIQLESTVRQFEELAQEYDSVTQTSNINRDAEIQLEVLTTEHIATSAQLNAVYSDLAATKARSDATLEAKELLHKQELEQLQFEVAVLKTRASRMDTSLDSSLVVEEEDEAVLRARIEERDRRIEQLEQEILRGEDLRRQMHNRIQELRGNIRVFVRCRPFLPSDQQSENPAINVSPDGESLVIADRNNAPCDFSFDKVFPPSSGQDQVFQEVSDFVQSALDGYQVCLFSYGQTGSGKTHTMQGSGNGAMRGIIPRAVEQILTQANKMHLQRWDFTLSASFLEIYNENLNDLLYSMQPISKGEPPKLAIKRNRAGKSYVDGLTEVPIESVDSAKGMGQLEALMSVAARARSVASTKMNAQSSRSHSVFMLHIRGCNAETGTEVQGSLNLCDLAGSERLDRSGAGSDAKRLKETQSINKSLSCLGDVFNALAQRANHIPFRNSKLTYLLQDCLSGDGKALMFVNLSPTTESSNESLCSLRFAQRVNQVELGKPTKNIQYNAH